MSDDWKLGNEEIGKSCGKLSLRDKNAKVYLPKAMPLISFGKPKKKSVPVKKSCFSNAKKCSPSVSRKIKSKNYIDIPVASRAWVRAKHGTKLKIAVKHNDIDQMSVKGLPDKQMN